jgi:hypothetical protein
MKTELACNSERKLAMMVRITGTVGSYAERCGTEHLCCNPGEIRTVHASAEGHDDGIERAKRVIETPLS